LKKLLANFNHRKVDARRMVLDNPRRTYHYRNIRGGCPTVAKRKGEAHSHISAWSEKRGCYGYILVILLVAPFFFGSCNFPGQRKSPPKVSLTISNTLSVKRTDVPIMLSLAEMKKAADNFSLNAVIVAYANTPQPIPIPSQVDDTDNDGEKDELVFLVDLEPQETKEIDVYYAPQENEQEFTVGYPRRTMAGVFPELKGIAWESELIAYRVPFNERTSVEVFFKEKSELALNRLAKDVSETWLDGGGYALWDGKNFVWHNREADKYVRVISAGPLRTIVQLTLSNWKFKSSSMKVTSTFSMFAGVRLAKHHLNINSTDVPPQIAVGLPQIADARPVFDEEKGYLYVWGIQSSGLAIIYPTEHFNSFQESKGSGKKTAGAVILHPGESRQIQYYFLATAGNGELAVETEEDFTKLIRHTIREINTPPIPNIRPSEGK